MAGSRWQDPVGLETINTIVKKTVPLWTNGLRTVQLELVSAILDGQDILCCTATGDGKSAAFSIPGLVLLEYNRHPGLYLPTRAKPIGVVVTPTKGLANNTINELSKLNISAFSYCHETLSEARKAGIRLAGEIKECIKWQVICVDPEHLRDKEWREITQSPTFRSNILFACVDEVHLINEWGLSFRPAFTAIGTFLRGRFPASISVIGLSATLEPGAPTASVCKSLGFFDGNFLLIRLSNERPNTQFSVQFSAHGWNGDKFPDLLPYLNSRRKTIIHCRTLNQVFRVYAYIWRLQPDGANKLIRARLYHSICPPEYNEETIQLIDTGPNCQIIIATVAFSNGLNAKSLLDSLSLGFATTFDESWQEKGRVGRNPETIGRGIIFSHRSIITEAESYLASLNSSRIQHSNLSKKKAPRILDKSKALVIAEKKCYIARINICYGNLPLEISSQDCLTAERCLPCSLCLARQGGGSLAFSPSPFPGGSPPLPVLTAPKVTALQKSSTPKKDKLKKKERAAAEKHLLNFGESIRRIERGSNVHKYRARSSYFPSHTVSLILDRLLIIHFPSDVEQLLNNSWTYHSSHGSALFDSIIAIQTSILVERNTVREITTAKQRERRKVPRVLEDEDAGSPSPSDSERSEQHVDSPSEEHVDESSSRKRQALEELTTTTKRRRAPRATQPSVAEVSESYGPCYRTGRHVAESLSGGDGKEGRGQRVSARLRKP